MKYILPFLLFCSLFLSCKKNDCTCATTKTLTIQPGPSDGNDVTANFHDGNPSSADNNGNQLNELAIYEWTNSGALVEGKAFISFDLSAVPAGSTIISAKLKLYGVSSSGWLPQGNAGENACLIQRVLSSWNESTLTWNTAPPVTTVNQVLSAPSTSVWNYDISVSVTDMVQDMINENKPYGFCLSMPVKSPYRGIIFGTSEVADASKRPKLEITYSH